MMRFYKQPHRFYCGVDLHAKTMHVCIVNEAGDILVHRNIKTQEDAFLQLIHPYREGLVVGVECMFSWYWLSDLCDAEKIDFVLGHALYIKAIHGGKSKNDKIDSEKIAMMLRGGMMPIAYAYRNNPRSDPNRGPSIANTTHMKKHRSERKPQQPPLRFDRRGSVKTPSKRNAFSASTDARYLTRKAI
jgi:transposase